MKPEAARHVPSPMDQRHPGRARTLALCGALAWCGLAQAQVATQQPLPEDVLPMSDLEDDPIGVDSSSRALDQVSAELRAEDEHALAQQALYGPLPPPLKARGGEVLRANQSVREVRHAVRVAFGIGLATVDVEQVFENLSTHPAEVEYRLALPAGSGLATLEVCNARGCRSGVEEAGTPGAGGAEGGLSVYDASVLARGEEAPLPVAHAVLVRDARGEAVSLRAAPVAKGRELTVRLRYVAPLMQAAGAAVLRLPARGMDARAAQTELSVNPGNFTTARIGRAAVGGEGVLLDPWTAALVRADDRRPGDVRQEFVRYRCGRQRCASAHIAAAPAPAIARDLVIALDVSPSTEGPARGRQLAAIAALLERAPPGTRVRAVAFAGRARVLVPDAMEPSEVSMRPFARALEQGELGSATRFEAVWQHARDWFASRDAARGGNRGGSLSPLIVLVGDGGITQGETRAFEQARRAGVEVSALNLSERSSSQALRDLLHRTGGVSVSLPAWLGRAEAESLEPIVSSLFAPTVARHVTVAGAMGGDGDARLGPLKAGASLSWSGPVKRRTVLRSDKGNFVARPADGALARALASAKALTETKRAGALVAVDARDLRSPRSDWPATTAGRGNCDRRGPAFRHGGVSADAQPVSVTRERVCRKDKPATASSGAALGKGMPAEPLLQMLRRRIMPAARGCFRRDRAGRGEYDRRAVFEFGLADREVSSAHVRGRIAESLRNCLLSAVDTLDVPRFDGVVNVRYPLVTESVAGPVVVELSGETAARVDALLGPSP